MPGPEVAEGARVPPWLASVCAGSHMGALVEAFDWASTPLGPPSAWPTGLRTAVSICLTSRFPMLVTWGPDLIQIYNDGYRPILGTTKHPAALGAPARRIWSEIWDVIGPLFASVLETGEATLSEHAPLVLHRNGFPEACTFLFSYSPLFDDEGRIAGVLDVVTETTAQILAQRRLGCLADLGWSTSGVARTTDLCVRAASTLARWTDDLPAVDLYLAAGDDLTLVASSRSHDVAFLDEGLLHRVASGQGPLVIGRSDGPVGPAEHVLLPVGNGPEGVLGVLAASLNPQLPYDDGYAQFLDLLSGTLGSGLEGAYRHTVEVGEHRRISDTLQRAILRPASDLPTVAARYLPAVGNLAVGGDWYDVMELEGDRRGLVVGDCVGHGLDAAAAMAQLRSAARAMLLEGRDPAAVLDGLDRFAASTENAQCATVLCAVIERGNRSLTYSRAGHPPALLADDSGCTWLSAAGGPPLAVPGRSPRTNALHQLSGEEVVVLYSDGLVERRGDSIDVGLERLGEAVMAARRGTVQQIADDILRDMLPEPARDDVVVVVKRLGGAAAKPA